MENLACMSARTCPACWHFTGNKCALMAQLRDAMAEPSIPGFAGPLLRLASA